MDNNEDLDTTKRLIQGIKDLLVEENLFSRDHAARYQKNITSLEEGGVITEHDMDQWRAAGKVVMTLRQLNSVVREMTESLPDPALIALNVIAAAARALGDVRLPTVVIEDDKLVCPVCDETFREYALEADIFSTLEASRVTEGDDPEALFKPIRVETLVMRHYNDNNDIAGCMLKPSSVTWRFDAGRVNEERAE